MGGISFAFRKLTDPQTLGVGWRDLEERADGSFFLSWDWIGCWLETVDTDVVVLEGRSEGRIVALALLCPVRHVRFGCFGQNAVYLNQTGDLAADRIAIEYNGVLFDRTVPTDAAQQALQALIEEDEFPWEQLFLRGLSSDFASAVSAGGARASVRLQSQSPTAGVDLAALRQAGESYLNQRSANTRAQIRRSIRCYEERGPLRLEVAEDIGQAHAFFHELGKLHQRYWNERGDPGAFSSSFAAAFHHRLIETALPMGHVEMVRLSAGEAVIGYLYNFVYRKTVFYYSSGFAYEHDNRLKPGLVAHTMCIEHHLAGEMERYDFMAGAARYKSSLGDIGPDIFAYVLERPGVNLAIRNTLRRIRDLIIR